MGKSGKPGASLSTFGVDTRNKESLNNIEKISGDKFDLIIGDGRHSIISSLNGLRIILKLIRVGGFAVVEDIPEVWSFLCILVARLIQPEYDSKLIRCLVGYSFAAQRVK